MTISFALDGRVVFVTGAASGIGQAVAVAAAEVGAAVSLFDRGDLSETAQLVEDAGGDLYTSQGSVLNGEELMAAIEGTVEKFGRVDGAVNCAGVASGGPAMTTGLSGWREVLDVDLTGTFMSCRAEAQSMMGVNRASIVNIASVSASSIQRGLPQAAYYSAKAGVRQLSKALAAEFAPSGLRVNSVSPGFTATPMNRRPDVAKRRPEFEKTIPLGRFAEAAEIAAPIVFLLSDGASYCTGVDLLVDGGCAIW